MTFVPLIGNTGTTSSTPSETASLAVTTIPSTEGIARTVLGQNATRQMKRRFSATTPKTRERLQRELLQAATLELEQSDDEDSNEELQVFYCHKLAETLLDFGKTFHAEKWASVTENENAHLQALLTQLSSEVSPDGKAIEKAVQGVLLIVQAYPADKLQELLEIIDSSLHLAASTSVTWSGLCEGSSAHALMIHIAKQPQLDHLLQKHVQHILQKVDQLLSVVQDDHSYLRYQLSLFFNLLGILADAPVLASPPLFDFHTLLNRGFERFCTVVPLAPSEVAVEMLLEQFSRQSPHYSVEIPLLIIGLSKLAKRTQVALTPKAKQTIAAILNQLERNSANRSAAQATELMKALCYLEETHHLLAQNSDLWMDTVLEKYECQGPLQDPSPLYVHHLAISLGKLGARECAPRLSQDGIQRLKVLLLKYSESNHTENQLAYVEALRWMAHSYPDLETRLFYALVCQALRGIDPDILSFEEVAQLRMNIEMATRAFQEQKQPARLVAMYQRLNRRLQRFLAKREVGEREERKVKRARTQPPVSQLAKGIQN